MVHPVLRVCCWEGGQRWSCCPLFEPPLFAVCICPPAEPRLSPSLLPAALLQEVLKEIVDSPELGRRGEAWFAAQLVALLLVAFPPGQLRPLLDAAGWLGIVGGLGMA